MTSGLPYESTEIARIIKIRYWQLLLNEMLLDRKFRIPIHLAFGHESLSVALSTSCYAKDKLCLTHRNATYNMAFCDEFQDVVKYYHLSSDTSPDLQMGSMNLAVRSTPVIYSSSILGNNLSVAAGLSMNLQLTQADGVIFVLTGDGAIEEGSFWETLIFARTHKLKLIILVENNNYSLGSTIDQRRSPILLQEICAGLDVKYFSADGANYLSSKRILSEAREIADAHMPVCIEFAVSTLCRHAGSTPGWDTDPMKISIKNGLIVEHTPRDPLFQIQQLCGDYLFNQIAESFLG